MTSLFYEDVEVGSSHRFGEYRVTLDEIIRFASEWDPLPIHTDDAYARDSLFGEITGCAAHSLAIMSLLTNHHNPRRLALLAGLGTEHMRFLQPLRADDVLSIQIEIVEKRISRSNPERGIVTTDSRLLNRRDEILVDQRGSALVRCRPTGKNRQED